MNIHIAAKRSAILVALLLNLGGCLSNPERPEASVYGEPPHSYEQTARTRSQRCHILIVIQIPGIL
jgi:hypothetical protein